MQLTHENTGTQKRTIKSLKIYSETCYTHTKKNYRVSIQIIDEREVHSTANLGSFKSLSTNLRRLFQLATTAS